jgi:CheY-like chemotaxis protein
MLPDRASAAVPEVSTVLLVEDESLLRVTTADHLRSVGYHVIEAATGEEAVRVLSAGAKVHVIFSDVSLPGEMGGFSLAMWIRNHLRFIPIVLTSGVESAVRPLRRQHLVPFISKPYLLEDVEQLLSRVLAQKWP